MSLLEALLELLTDLAPASGPFGLRVPAPRSGRMIRVLSGGALTFALRLDGESVAELDHGAPLPEVPGLGRLLEMLGAQVVATRDGDLHTTDPMEMVEHPFGPPLVAIIEGQGGGSSPPFFWASSATFAAAPEVLLDVLAQGDFPWQPGELDALPLGDGPPPLVDDYLVSLWDEDPQHPVLQEALDGTALRRGTEIRLGRACWPVTTERMELFSPPKSRCLVFKIDPTGSTSSAFARDLLGYVRRAAPVWSQLLDKPPPDGGGAWNLAVTPLPWRGSEAQPTLDNWASSKSRRRALVVVSAADTGLETLARQAVEKWGAHTWRQKAEEQRFVLANALHDLKNLLPQVLGLRERGPEHRLDDLIRRARRLEFASVLLQQTVTPAPPITPEQLLAAARANRGRACEFAAEKLGSVPPEACVHLGGGGEDPENPALDRLLQNLIANALAASANRSGCASERELPRVEIVLNLRGLSIHNACCSDDLDRVDDALCGTPSLGSGLRTCLTAARLLGLQLQLDRQDAPCRATVQLYVGSPP